MRRSLGALALACWASVIAAGQDAPAQEEADRLRAMERRAAERLSALQREADDLAARQRGLLDQLRVLQLRRDAAKAEAARANAAVEAAEAEIAHLSERRAATGRALDARRPQIQARLAALYRAGPGGDLRRWLSAGSTAGKGSSSRLLAAVAARDRREFAAFAALRDDLEEEDRQLQRQREALGASHADAVAARESAARAAANHEALVTQLDLRRDLAAQLAGELENAREALQRRLDGLASEGSAPAALPVAAFRGALPWPARGPVLEGFGRRTSPRFGTAVARNGIQIGAGEGSAVTAVHEGRVAFADEFAGLGRLVILDHGRGAFSLYGYLDEVGVQRGTAVDRGAALGRSGRSPSGEAAVYFELRVDARPVNPLEWLKR